MYSVILRRVRLTIVIVEKHYHRRHHVSVMELGHLWTRSGLTYPEVSSKVYHYSFCQLGSSVSLPWVIYFEAFYLHVVTTIRKKVKKVKVHPITGHEGPEGE